MTSTPRRTTATPSDDDARRRHGAALSSILVNVVLLAAKVVVGLWTGSIALWASAADSFLDLTASSFAYAGVRIGARPPDRTHAYGHGKFESLSSLVQLGLLFVTVGVIAYEAWQRLIGEPSVRTPLAGVALIAVSLLVDLWISRRLTRVARETGGSEALEADALHFATDVWSNLAVIVGLLAVRFGFPLGDPLAAIAVALLVAVTAWGLLQHTTGSLTDTAPDPDVVARMVAVIESFDEVETYHTLRARRVGSRIFLDLCVELDPTLTFARAHDVSHELQDRLQESVPEIADAVIHFEPAGHPAHQDRAHHDHGFDALSLDRQP